jgi:hypothetical protein
MSVDLRYRLAEMMREARIGNTRFGQGTYDADDWLRSADVMLRIADRYGVSIGVSGEPAAKPVLPETVYSVIGHNPSTERQIRRGDKHWHIVSLDRKTGDSKTILEFDLTATDIDADRVMAGDPAARDLPALLSRLAASTLIRKLHADAEAR